MRSDHTPTPIPIPATGLPGNLSSDEDDEPSLWHQVDAFRELLQEGAQLLGEVLLFTRNAEESLAALDREKASLDQEREALRQEKQKACREVNAAAEQLRAQEEQLKELRERLERTENERLQLNQNEAENNRSLQRALRETEKRAEELEDQLRLMRQPCPGIAQEQVEETVGDATRLKNLEHELEQTRLILAGERLRRNRAISLIRPSTGKGAAQ